MLVAAFENFWTGFLASGLADFLKTDFQDLFSFGCSDGFSVGVAVLLVFLLGTEYRYWRLLPFSNSLSCRRLFAFLSEISDSS